MIRLSSNANGLRGASVETAVRAVADTGYEAVEFSLHPCHIDPFNFREKLDHQKLMVLERYGTDRLMLNSGFHFGSADPFGLARACCGCAWLGWTPRRCTPLRGRTPPPSSDWRLTETAVCSRSQP
jgi:hypothetical protein